MTRIRLFGAAIAIVAVAGAVASATASALLPVPEIGRCVKVASGTGEYEVASCIGGAKAAGGNYAWQSGTKPKFLGGGGVTVLETTGGKKIECKGWGDEGEYYKPFPQDEELEVTLIGCKDVALNVECGNAAPGVILLKMFGEFGFIRNALDKAGHLVVSVGMNLKLDDPQHFECGPNKNKFVISGAAIGVATPIDKMSTTFTFNYKAKKGKQKPAMFEGRAAEPLVLEQIFPAMPPEAAGLTAANTNTNEEPLEIKAKE